MHRAPQVSSLARMATLIVVLGFGAAQPAGPGLAQSSTAAAIKAKGLDMLFGQLKAAKDEYEAGKIEEEILELWHQSGRPEIDKLSVQAIDLMVRSLYSRSVQVLDEIIQRAPDWADGWNMRATAHYLLGAFERSLADIVRVLALEPRHFGALSAMGHIHMHKGQYREALAAFRKALAIHPFLNARLDVIPELEKKVGDKAQ